MVDVDVRRLAAVDMHGVRGTHGRELPHYTVAQFWACSRCCSSRWR
jgi:hypothetical protein